MSKKPASKLQIMQRMFSWAINFNNLGTMRSRCRNLRDNYVLSQRTLRLMNEYDNTGDQLKRSLEIDQRLNNRAVKLGIAKQEALHKHLALKAF